MAEEARVVSVIGDRQEAQRWVGVKQENLEELLKRGLTPIDRGDMIKCRVI